MIQWIYIATVLFRIATSNSHSPEPASNYLSSRFLQIRSFV